MNPEEERHASYNRCPRYEGRQIQASGSTILTMNADQMAVTSIRPAMSLIQEVATERQWPMDIPTRVTDSAHSEAIQGALRERLDDVMSVPLSESRAPYRTASPRRQSVIEYNPASTAPEDYRALADEVRTALASRVDLHLNWSS